MSGIGTCFVGLLWITFWNNLDLLGILQYFTAIENKLPIGAST